MKHFSLSEHRLLALAPDNFDEQEGNASWTFGDVPLGSQVSGGYLKTEGTYYQKNRSDQVVPLNGRGVWENIPANAPINKVILPSEKDVRQNYENILKTPPEYGPNVPLGMIQAQRAELLDLVSRSQNGPAYGPDHNPFDRLRIETPWADVPENAFFTLSKKPGSKSMVYLKTFTNSCMPICTFDQWRQKMPISNLKEEQRFSELRDDDYKPYTTATVLGVMNVDEFDKDIDVVRQAKAKSGKPLDEAFMTQRRDRLSAFWERVKKTGTGL